MREPQACVARLEADGQGEIWSSSQGHFVVRALTAQLVGMKIGDLRVYPAELGGARCNEFLAYDAQYHGARESALRGACDISLVHRRGLERHFDDLVGHGEAGV